VERDGGQAVGGREEELALVRHWIVVKPDLDRPDEVLGFHRMVHRDLQRHGARIFRQGRSVDHGTVFAIHGQLCVQPTRYQKRHGCAEE